MNECIGNEHAPDQRAIATAGPTVDALAGEMAGMLAVEGEREGRVRRVTWHEDTHHREGARKRTAQQSQQGTTNDSENHDVTGELPVSQTDGERSSQVVPT